MEQAAQNYPGTNFPLRTRPTEGTSPTHSSSSDEQSSGSRAPPRRRSLPSSKNTKAPPARINTSQAGTKSTKAMSAGPRSGTSHGAIMAMSGTISPAHEITYTPTTHRISKAKKGKKVHACEYPGCTKIFTRAEHRKRHEANHNAVPLFQCDIEGCRKPFQRADLLTRHMERQHNMPVASPSAQHPQAHRSASDVSTAHSNPTTPSIVRPNLPQQSLNFSPQPLAQPPSRSMSIGSGLDRPEYASHHPFAAYTETSHLPIPPNPRNNLPPELVYGLSASDSPYCSSTDSSCYSPRSDLIQPQIATQPYLPQDDLPRAPQSAGVLECGYPHTMYASPMEATGEAMAAAWNYDQPPLSAPIIQGGFGGLGMSMTRHFQYPSPTFMSAATAAAEPSTGLPYEMGTFAEQWMPPFRKVTF